MKPYINKKKQELSLKNIYRNKPSINAIIFIINTIQKGERFLWNVQI